jgi:hypothetical protein
MTNVVASSVVLAPRFFDVLRTGESCRYGVVVTDRWHAQAMDAAESADWLAETTVCMQWPPRNTWPDEERDLTPWVIEHLAELGANLGMRLTLVEREARIGAFRADIVAVDDHGRKVIIENQFGPTDHLHFGQMVLYGLETSADVVIWLATDGHRQFIPYGIRPEHRRALHRLNEKLGPEIAFYGVELSVESEPRHIGELDGPPMEILRVVVAPKNGA